MAKVIDWVKTNYDRAVLIAAAVFLFISAVAIWWSTIQFGNQLIAPGRVPQKMASQPPVAAELDRAAEQLQKPFQWKSNTRSGLFVPEKHFIGADGMPATLQNTQAAESTIRDADMAQEMTTFTKNNILQQAAQSMLSQANQGTQGILQLLRG